jgi:hypothetical protein
LAICGGTYQTHEFRATRDPCAVVDFAVEFAKGAKNRAKLPVKNFY